MTNDNVTSLNATQLNSRTFGGTEVKSLIGAISFLGIHIYQDGDVWRMTAKRALPNFDMTRTHSSFDEAVLTITGHLIQNQTYRTVLEGVPGVAA